MEKSSTMVKEPAVSSLQVASPSLELELELEEQEASVEACGFATLEQQGMVASGFATLASVAATSGAAAAMLLWNPGML